MVSRTNGAIIKGFETDVGSRTTHYTFSTNTLMNSMRSYAGAGYRGPPVSEVSMNRKHLVESSAGRHVTLLLFNRKPDTSSCQITTGITC